MLPAFSLRELDHILIEKGHGDVEAACAVLVPVLLLKLRNVGNCERPRSGIGLADDLLDAVDCDLSTKDGQDTEGQAVTD